jgi:hypothetical protein
MSDKREIPIDAAQLLLARKGANKVSSVSVSEDGRLVPNGHEDALYKIAIRKVDKAGERKPSNRVSKLKVCKGLKGCDFAECVKNAFGKLPKNLEGLCPTNEANADEENIHV